MVNSLEHFYFFRDIVPSYKICYFEPNEEPLDTFSFDKAYLSIYCSKTKLSIRCKLVKSLPLKFCPSKS